VKRLHTRFTDEGMVIAFPIRTIAHRETPPHGRAQRVAGAA
jgi:hypothetical protein